MTSLLVDLVLPDGIDVPQIRLRSSMRVLACSRARQSWSEGDFEDDAHADADAASAAVFRTLERNVSQGEIDPVRRSLKAAPRNLAGSLSQAETLAGQPCIRQLFAV